MISYFVRSLLSYVERRKNGLKCCFYKIKKGQHAVGETWRSLVDPNNVGVIMYIPFHG